MKPALCKFLAAAIAVVLPACKNEDTSRQSERPETSSSVLLPLAVGKQWSYTRSEYDSLGNQLSSRQARTLVEADTVVGGERWYGLLDEEARNEGEQATFTANRPDGVYMLGRDGQGVLLYRYPAVPGDQCPPFVVVSTDTAVTCPVGTFKCYVYQDATTYAATPQWSLTVTTRDFIAPGVGLIRHEVSSVWTDTAAGTTVPGPRDITEATAL